MMKTKYEIGQEFAEAIFCLNLAPEVREGLADLLVAGLYRLKATVNAHKAELRKAGIRPDGADIKTPQAHLATIATVGALLPTLTPAEVELVTVLVFGLIQGQFSATTLADALEAIGSR